MKKRVFITVKGIVQGVGFRPFIYNLASEFKLDGWVNNNSEGVYIDLQGDNKNLNEFICKLKNSAPPLSKIESIDIKEKALEHHEGFYIKESEKQSNRITLISPDISLCKDCEEDILNVNNKRYYYPFTNCTNCGPRFSIIKSIPYDRDKTTMKKFKMCLECKREYENPRNRRFHAQPNACSMCGPSLTLMDNKGNLIKPVALEKENINKAIIDFTKQKLKEGYIFAIKGLTGFHLVCHGKNEEAIKLLRERKRRPHKPFAVMMKDIDTVKKYCNINKDEEKLMSGIRKPIVLLKKISGCSLPLNLAPSQINLGVMLPYTPLHRLIFTESIEVLVMTSANISGLPLEYKNDSAFNNLKDIADFFLMHDRDIYIPVDDSVSRICCNHETIIRRARGYVPEPIKYNACKSILALGGNMKNTFCISKENFIFLSSHNGDLENIETINHFKKNIEHFNNIFDFHADYVACDMHPEYNSTHYAESLGLPIIKVQHHHAHIVSCMMENNIKDKVIGVAFDGTGYGTDNNIWGGEFLISTLKDFERAGHINYVPMAGGDKSIEEPWRMAVSYIYHSYGCNNSNKEMLKIIDEKFGTKGLNLLTILSKNINSIYTSSAGRLFDAVASIIGFTHNITYEGQASIELENLLYNAPEFEDFYSFNINCKDYPIIINTENLIKGIIKDSLKGVSPSIISRKFHNTMVSIICEACLKLKKDTFISKVALSGGVFQNRFLLESCIERLSSLGFEVFFNNKIPTNDGGISVGQLIAADSILKNS